MNIFLCLYTLLALNCGAHGSSLGEFIENNYQTVLVIIAAIAVVGLIAGMATWCMEAVLEVLKLLAVALLFVIKCLWCFLCCNGCCCEKEEENKPVSVETEEIPTVEIREPPTTNQPTTVINIGGLNTQTTQHHMNNLPVNGMAMPVAGMPNYNMAMPNYSMAMPTYAMCTPAPAMMPNANMTMSVGMPMQNIGVIPTMPVSSDPPVYSK